MIYGKDTLLYLRVSDRTQVENGSLEAQENKLRKCCKERNYHILKVIKDIGTGTDNALIRPGFQKVIGYCSDDRYQGRRIRRVLVSGLDRISRDKQEVETIVNLFAKQFGVDIISVK